MHYARIFEISRTTRQQVAWYLMRYLSCCGDRWPLLSDKHSTAQEEPAVSGAEILIPVPYFYVHWCVMFSYEIILYTIRYSAHARKWQRQRTIIRISGARAPELKGSSTAARRGTCCTRRPFPIRIIIILYYMRPQLHIIRIILQYMCSAYNRKSLRGSAAAASAASRARCGAAVGVLNGTYASKRTSGRFRACLPVGFSGEKSARAISRPEKNRRFRSAVLVRLHRKPDTIRRRKSTKKKKMFRNAHARSVGGAWAKSFFTACGHTGFKCNTLFENFPSTRAARLWASAALT